MQSPTDSQTSPVVGRFAPTPSGILHFGSLVTAVASFFMARQARGRWLVRMEDLDWPRAVPGAADRILHQLEAFGLTWDGPVLYQSRRTEFYRDQLSDLHRRNLVYPCTCSRREVSEQSLRQTADGPVYSGCCRNKRGIPDTAHAWRLRTCDLPVSFSDLLHGVVVQNVAHDVGDFILQRSDSIFAYQFATPLDDADQGVNQVVRGNDLLWSTPRQIWLLQQLSRAIPTYCHLPLALRSDGTKISKSDSRHPVLCDTTRDDLPSFLILAFSFLGLQVPREFLHCRCNELLTWAIDSFRLDSVSRSNQIVKASLQE
ncbi:MAG: tRNA glutamyl-Q(34) synthetase GluQRS [Desulfuromonadaceae bacterium]|nr:tRNA glutamyl-Q(34) synthetase GluQRS [Desulfuromonadaceae bacterium]